MLRVDERFECKDSFLEAAFPKLRQYYSVQQVFNAPLWIIDALCGGHKDGRVVDMPRWSRQIASDIKTVLKIIQSPQWGAIELHVILPKHMSKVDGDIQLARCSAIWDANFEDEPEEIYWIVETDICSFSEPDPYVEKEDLHKRSLCWRS